MDSPPVQYATTTDGYNIAYATSGKRDATPLLFLPGSFNHVQSAWQYPGLQNWLERLAERFRLIQFDPRGNGMSSRDLREGLSRADFQKDIEAVLDRLNPPRLLIYAASSGVDFAVDYALQQPQKVIGLILGTSGQPRSASFFEALPAEDWDAFLYSLVPRDRSREEGDRIVDLMRQASDQTNFLLRFRLLANDEEMESMLSRLTAPALVMYSRGYALTPVEESMKRAQQSHGRFVLIDGTDPWGNADQGMRAIESFVADVLPQDVPVIQRTQGLSSRELEVLKLIAAGKSNQQIADELVLSVHTVARHVANILSKASVANRTEAAGYARDRGLA